MQNSQGILNNIYPELNQSTSLLIGCQLQFCIVIQNMFQVPIVPGEAN